MDGISFSFLFFKKKKRSIADTDVTLFLQILLKYDCLARSDHSAVAMATLYLFISLFLPLEGKCRPELRCMTRHKHFNRVQRTLPVLHRHKGCLAESQRSVERRQWLPPQTAPTLTTASSPCGGMAPVR